ncbi:hypothetical protein FQN55_002194 [Onygenales sp. PD_40]|nr:hypothetical protein FQN55_002194 [Onygenales sp. PD_40]KAK2786372.1 hypothetical protein FQN52_007829 [Onygenales sp. PD_12]KAK2790168.1 hypothetical protein FQN51_002499 [Onygenales sp. PD_10]
MGPALTAADYSLPVNCIRVTIHTLGKFFESDTRSGNHASIFLLTGDEMSVRLNMTKAAPTDTMGTYTQERCLYDTSRTSLHDMDLPAVQGFTVQHVIHLINEKGRHKYRLAPSGVGCRFWVKTVIEDLKSAGYIDPVSAVQVCNGLQYNYSRDREPEFEAIVPGTFV